MTTYDVVPSVTDRDAEELWPVYDAVFGDQVDEGTWRNRVWDRHAARAGFRLARAHDESPDGERHLVGFCYGYTGERGQWWTDRAAEVLDAGTAERWLGGHFELVSIGVLPEVRGRGIGAALLRLLTDGVPHDRWVLMTTADADGPARHLYATEGWEVIGPGLEHEQVIMGRRRRP